MPKPGWSRAYWSLALMWPVVILPLTYLAAVMLDATINSFQLRGSDPLSYPILTQWFQSLGTTALYGLTAMPLAVSLLLGTWRSRPFAVWGLGISVVAAIYLAFGGMLAAYLAYVKLCI